MNNLADPAKTKPILPAVGLAGLPCFKRQLSRIRPHSREPVLSAVLSLPKGLPAVSAVEPSKDNSPNLKSEICDLKSRLRLTSGPRPLISLPSLYCYPCYSLTSGSHPANSCPSKHPILTRKFSNVLHISQTYSNAIPPLFVSYLHLFVNFHTLKHFSTPPTPIFAPKTQLSHASNSHRS